MTKTKNEKRGRKRERRLILFVCNENSARSQIAEGFFNHYKQNTGYISLSAGTHPAKKVKPFAIEVMKEKGIDISGKKPKPCDLDIIKSAYRIYTMGCMESCPITPAEKTEDWNLEDPAGKSIEEYRNICNEIERRILKMIDDLD